MKKTVHDFKFEVEFGYSCDLITLKVCDHYQVQAYVTDGDFRTMAEYLAVDTSSCPVCGKVVE